jgi:hypothetical protein
MKVVTDEKPKWVLKWIAPEDLHEHPVSLEIYSAGGGAREFDGDLMPSIEEHGVLEPLRATNDLTLLAGHRRRQCAIDLRIDSVAVLVCQQDLSAEDQVIEIVEANRSRDKTKAQRAREFMKLAEAKAELARKRQRTGKKDLAKKVAQGRRATAKDEAAADVGLSRPTAEKAAAVVKEIDKAAAAGETERAADLLDTLNNKSVSAAHEKAKVSPEPRRRRPQRRRAWRRWLKNAAARKMTAVSVTAQVWKSISEAVHELHEMPPLPSMEVNRSKLATSLLELVSGVDDAENIPANGTPRTPLESLLAGVGIIRGNEAINALSRIPKEDPFRRDAFDMVRDWITSNTHDAIDDAIKKTAPDKLIVPNKAGGRPKASTRNRAAKMARQRPRDAWRGKIEETDRTQN